MATAPSLSNPPATLGIVETFHSVQGEGYWAGTNAFFIRLAGCDVGCPWCDTKVSWNPKRHPQVPIVTLRDQVQEAQPRLVIITGGEPLLQDLTPLTQALQPLGYPLHLETSGAYPLRGEVDWITLSPKLFKPPQPSLYALAHELKVVIASPEDFSWAEQQREQVNPEIPCYLQPEWGQREAPAWIYDYVLGNPQWRLSLQTHKVLAVR